MCTTQSEVTFTPAELTRKVAAGDVGAKYGPDSGAALPDLNLTEAKFVINGVTYDFKNDFQVEDPYLSYSSCSEVEVTYIGTKLAKLAMAEPGELNFEWSDPALASFKTTARFSLASVALRPAV